MATKTLEGLLMLYKPEEKSHRFYFTVRPNVCSDLLHPIMMATYRVFSDQFEHLAGRQR